MDKTPKIIIAIVEGPSDQVALSFLNGLARHTNFIFKVINGDITSDKNNSPSDILTKLNATVKEFIKMYGLKLKDVAGIIHIVDTDGAFIPEECVVEDLKCLSGPFYESDAIRTAYVAFSGRGI